MTEPARAQAFDITGPLPSGVTVLEASAGTGKTYTIAALAARYVADGVPLDQLLLVTFTRMATGELRERVRERLVSVRRGLCGKADHTDDEIVELLRQGSEPEIEERLGRLVRALADFDAATIATTHGFCQEVLAGLGVAGDAEQETTFVEDISDLVEEVVDDLFVRRFHHADDPPFKRREARDVASAAIKNPATPIAPATGAVPEIRRRLAQAALLELELRKRRMGVMTHDDLLTRLDEALAGDGGSAAAARLRARYSVVLVDEFQDTDPVQWDIVRRAFGHGDTTLVLIGDPKQAIYAFRGADVYSYLEAARSAGARATLDVNWRSDKGLIDAYDAMFVGAKLGHEGIVYRHVRAADANQSPRLSGAPCDAPVRLRVVHRDDPSIVVTKTGCAGNLSSREHIARDLAADVVKLLSSAARVEARNDAGEPVSTEQVRPRHIAVLVRTNRNAAQVREALGELGVPAVINGAGSVFGTAPATDWLRLLEALERPMSPLRAHSAALTCFIGWSPEEVAAADEEAWEDIHRRLHDWARVIRLRGVAALMETIGLVEGLPKRILVREDGERWLTDLRHVGQLLHAETSGEQLGITALAAWLRRRIAESVDDTADEERSRRLESDAEAVQVLTIHRSKGLEFPFVYLPFLWEPGFTPKGEHPVSFHDPEAGDIRTIDVALQGNTYQDHKRLSLVEQRGEDLRLAYVALTRARHQAVIWWAGSWDSRNSPLGRLLFSRGEDGSVQPDGTDTPNDAAAVARFEELATKTPGCISVETSTLGLPMEWAPDQDQTADLGTAAFGRGFDRRWRRTSYSDIAAGAYEHRVGSEPEREVPVDEPVEVSAPVTSGHIEPDLVVPSLLADMPVGLKVGTLVHEVFQTTDFAAPELQGEVRQALNAALSRQPVDLGQEDVVVEGLTAAIETPLGPLVDNVRLRDISRGDRLDELGFELPLAGGDEPTGEVAIAAIAALLRENLPSDDPLTSYAERLDDPVLRRSVRGYLTGSIDSVLRLPSGRFAIVDFKTNWLAPPDEALTTWHHRSEALLAEMNYGHYGLQALLYTAALHRYLRWRLPDYDVDRDFAGVLYLFVRGMVGPQTPLIDRMPCGVFAWKPPAPFVIALSDILDGRK